MRKRKLIPATMITRARWATFLTCCLLLFPVTGWAQDREREAPASEERDRGKETSPELREALRGLEQGMKALEMLGRREELEILRRVARDVRRELGEGERSERERTEGRRREDERRDRRAERPRTEREVELENLEIMRMAIPALREANRRDAAELIERTIRAREVVLERRTDEEARRIRAGAPPIPVQVEALAAASRLWREFGNADRARAVGGLAERMAARFREREGRGRERESAERRERAERREAEREVREDRGERRERAGREADEERAARREAERDRDPRRDRAERGDRDPDPRRDRAVRRDRDRDPRRDRAERRDPPVREEARRRDRDPDPPRDRAVRRDRPAEGDAERGQGDRPRVVRREVRRRQIGGDRPAPRPRDVEIRREFRMGGPPRAEIAALRREIAQLREEIRKLRQLLARVLERESRR